MSQLDYSRGGGGPVGEGGCVDLLVKSFVVEDNTTRALPFGGGEWVVGGIELGVGVLDGETGRGSVGVV